MPSILDQTFGFSLLTFAFFTTVALVAGIYMFRQEAKTTGCDRHRIDDLCLWMLIAAIIGARLFYFILHPEALAAGVMEIFRFWNGGVSLAGGAAAAAAVGFGYTKSFNMPILRTLDALAPAVAIGQFFAWLGCFFSGFCHQVSGYPVSGNPIAPLHPDAISQVQLHPSSLFVAACHFVIFGLLLVVKQHRRFNGQTFWLYALMVGILGLVAGLVTDSDSAAVFFGISRMVVFNAAVALAAIAALLILGRRRRKKQTVEVTQSNGESQRDRIDARADL